MLNAQKVSYNSGNVVPATVESSFTSSCLAYKMCRLQW